MRLSARHVAPAAALVLLLGVISAFTVDEDDAPSAATVVDTETSAPVGPPPSTMQVLQATQAARTGTYVLELDINVPGLGLTQLTRGVYDNQRPANKTVQVFRGDLPEDEDITSAELESLIVSSIVLDDTAYLNITTSPDAAPDRWLTFAFSDLEEIGGFSLGELEFPPLADALALADGATGDSRQITTELPAFEVITTLFTGQQFRDLVLSASPSDFSEPVAATLALDAQGRLMRADLDLTAAALQLLEIAGLPVDQQVRRSSTVSASLILRGLGDPVSIQAPPPSQVVSQEDFTGFD